MEAIDRRQKVLEAEQDFVKIKLEKVSEAVIGATTDFASLTESVEKLVAPVKAMEKKLGQRGTCFIGVHNSLDLVIFTAQNGGLT